ncbi:Uncharacterised protein [uncultured archaeon]|nr:Uncharacterised protein [uncultured archaeon]
MTENMLKTPQERVKLLKNGMEGKKIEELYIQYNNFKIIRSPILFDFTNPLKEIAEGMHEHEHPSDAPDLSLKHASKHRRECP